MKTEDTKNQPTNLTSSKEFSEGATARMNNVPPTQNPYHAYTEAYKYKEWQHGWIYAQPCENLKVNSFDIALSALKQGNRVRRKAWPKWTYMFLLPENSIPKTWIKDPILKKVADEISISDNIKCLAAFRFKTSNDEIVTGFTLEAHDILSEDWIILD